MKKLSFLVLGIITAALFIAGNVNAYPIPVDALPECTGDFVVKYGDPGANNDDNGTIWTEIEGDSDLFIIEATQWKDNDFGEPIYGIYTWNGTGDPWSGEWYMEVKAATETRYYQINPASGTWSWFGDESTNNAAVSHIAFYHCETHVPIPAAAWLLGSGLVGLVGIRMRKKRQ